MDVLVEGVAFGVDAGLDEGRPRRRFVITPAVPATMQVPPPLLPPPAPLPPPPPLPSISPPPPSQLPTPVTRAFSANGIVAPTSRAGCPLPP
eukprot:2397243-Pleurochrysis_carterae.AAC.1